MKRFSKKILVLLLAAAMILGLSFPSFVSAATPRLSKEFIGLYVGQKYTLKAKNFSGTVKWKTNNKKVATVNQSGVVTARSFGDATITAIFGKQS
ncbi:MAG: Ig-like domain-containing protein, partial [Blautia sp.]|nr:Ig-like domain-containing protein [Blautia sp.]